MNETVATEKIQLYSIECRTGCTCCSYENHSRGLYATMAEAERRVKNFESIPLLASQFSKTGRYSIRFHDAEKLPDGRMIVADERVIGTDKIYAVDEKGEIGGADDRLGDAGWPS